MKRFAITFIFIGLAISASAQEIDQDRIDFVNTFYLAVKDYKRSKVIKCMDKKYRKEQIKFLDGSKQQFVDELFGGIDLETGEYIAFEMSEVENFEIQDVRNLGENRWEYVFLVKSKDRFTELTLELKKTGRKYGFIGAVG